MIERYLTPEMREIFFENSRWDYMLKVEKAVAEVEAEFGIIPEEAARNIIEKARVDTERIKELEKETNHDVVAFVFQLEETVGQPHGRWIHYGLTSYDVVDTALSLQLKEAGNIILKEFLEVLEVLKRRAYEFKNLLTIGRTHGMHAEPMSFGLKFARWYSEFLWLKDLFEKAVDEISYGKVSGTVGAFGSLPPQVEEEVCHRLGLKPEPASTQIIRRSRHAFLLQTVALIGSCIENCALEIRHLHRSEVAEVLEPFGKKQTGSSAMPHKKNPIRAERLCGIARLLRGNSLVALENIPLWHERDISHSSAERFIFIDSLCLLHYALRLFKNVLEGLTVLVDNVRKNLEMAHKGYFSQYVLLALIKKGYSRQEAYSIVQKLSFEALQKGIDFEKVVESSGLFLDNELKEIFDETRFIKYVDKIFERIFND